MVQTESRVMRYKELQKVSVPAASPSEDNRIRRASYYVWFLGAEECRGLRGSEVVRPVLQYLLERERDHEPGKVTLQVSGRGIKLLQQAATSKLIGAGSMKHFIPSGALTYVQQEEPPDDDIVSAVLLIYNPVTKCPVHVHTYRCDSTETADVLRQHLEQLLQRPEQQAKVTALESRLASRGLLPHSSGRASDGASSGSSVSSGGGSGSGRGMPVDKMASLYDSLAAELREKLGTHSGPLLLPPKDYERTRRRRKRLLRIDLNFSPRRKAVDDDSARSSGIGSDDGPSGPSPTHEKDLEGPERRCSSDEEWAAHDRGAGDNFAHSWRNKNASPMHTPNGQRSRTAPHNSPGAHLSPIRVIPTRRPSRRLKDRSSSPASPKDRFHDARDKFLSLERRRSAHEVIQKTYPAEGVGRSISWEIGQRGRDMKCLTDLRHEGKRDRRSREDMGWLKSDRDPSFGSRDLLRERRQRIPIEAEYWKRESERRTPDVFEYGCLERSVSPMRNRPRTPDRDYRKPRPKSPNRHDYQRAKSMHDLSQRRFTAEDEGRSRDPRRRSLYDPADPSGYLQDSRRPVFSSHTHLAHHPSFSSSSNSSSPSGLYRYNELPENQRFPGLDRATARPDPLEVKERLNIKRTFDYPVNGGHTHIHITRAQHDDYRRFRYDHCGGQFIRGLVVSPPQY